MKLLYTFLLEMSQTHISLLSEVHILIHEQLCFPAGAKTRSLRGLVRLLTLPLARFIGDEEVLFSHEEKEVTRKVRGRLIRLKTEAMAKAELCEDRSCPGIPHLLDESHCTAEGFSLSKIFSALKPMLFQ